MQGYKTHVQSGILLNANEASQNVDENIKQEILEAISNLSLNRYPDTTCQELHSLYADIMNVPSSWILSGNGSDQMLGFLIQYYLRENKTLYTLSPDFSMYDYYVGLNHSKIEKYETNQDGSFDVDAFISNGKDKKVDMILFSNPNNPTGHAITLCEMKKISEAFKDIPVIFDEAYMEFGKESAIGLLKTYPMVFVCRTLSKAYGLAGIRCGFMLGQQVEKLRDLFIPYALSSVTQTIASVVLKHADAYKDNMATIISERERMYQEVKEFKKLTIYPSNANFLFGRSEKKDLLLKMFKEKNITIRNYEDASFRITIGTKEENEIIDCPNCSGKIVMKRSKRGKVFYGCNNYPECKTAYWDKPISDKCPKCNSVLTIKGKKIKCTNCDYEKELD